MPTLIFRGAFMRPIDLRYERRSKQAFVRINFSADYSDTVAEALGWGEVVPDEEHPGKMRRLPPPEWIEAGDLDGEYTAIKFVLVPNGELKNNEIDIPCKEISGFHFARIQDPKHKDSTILELRFQIHAPAYVDTLTALARYLNVVGEGKAQLRVQYEAQSEVENEAEEAKESNQGELVEMAPSG